MKSVAAMVVGGADYAGWRFCAACRFRHFVERGGDENARRGPAQSDSYAGPRGTQGKAGRDGAGMCCRRCAGASARNHRSEEHFLIAVMRSKQRAKFLIAFVVDAGRAAGAELLDPAIRRGGRRRGAAVAM